MFTIYSLLSNYMALAAFVLVSLAIWLNRRRLQLIYDKIEGRFMLNFKDKEKQEAMEGGVSHLAPWDAHMAGFLVPDSFSGLGNRLSELKLRELIGINIAMIKRGQVTIYVPGRDERIYPGDMLFVIGTDEQHDSFRDFLQQNTRLSGKLRDNEEELVSLQYIDILPDSELAGKSIRESAIRERSHGLIVGIELQGARILNPESSVILQPNDVVWIVGDKRRIRILAGWRSTRYDEQVQSGSAAGKRPEDS